MPPPNTMLEVPPMSDSVKVSIRNLYKIFGDDPLSVLHHAHDGIAKQEMLERYGHVIGLRDIKVDMHDGEITVIMGLSGSGKSTLIRHVNRLIEPTAGEMTIDGIDVMSQDSEELRHFRQTRMSMVFQKFALLPHRTVLQNAAMPLLIRGVGEDEALARGTRWLTRVGLDGFEEYYPHQLSGGMQQRVGIARALTSDCPIMLLDEAFSALDPLIRTDMQDLLLALQKDLRKTIVFITHDLDEALKLADHLVILKDGHVVQQDEPQRILLDPNDPYIEDFVSDINRARVVRARSVMSELTDIPDAAGEVDGDSSLESVIEMSGGDTDCAYYVTRDGERVGVLDMTDLIKALVPRVGSENAVRGARNV